jgi:hypothetical protein
MGRLAAGGWFVGLPFLVIDGGCGFHMRSPEFLERRAAVGGRRPFLPPAGGKNLGHRRHRTESGEAERQQDERLVELVRDAAVKVEAVEREKGKLIDGPEGARNTAGTEHEERDYVEDCRGLHHLPRRAGDDTNQTDRDRSEEDRPVRDEPERFPRCGGADVVGTVVGGWSERGDQYQSQHRCAGTAVAATQDSAAGVLCGRSDADQTGRAKYRERVFDGVGGGSIARELLNPRRDIRYP